MWSPDFFQLQWSYNTRQNERFGTAIQITISKQRHERLVNKHKVENV